MGQRIPPKVRAQVLERDGYRCMAPDLDRNADWCRDLWGHLITRWPGRDPGPTMLQMSHIKDEGKPMMGKKAPPDRAHLIALCPWHHTGTKAGVNWETQHRHLIRAHLRRVEE